MMSSCHDVLAARQLVRMLFLMKCCGVLWSVVECCEVVYVYVCVIDLALEWWSAATEAAWSPARRRPARPAMATGSAEVVVLALGFLPLGKGGEAVGESEHSVSP